ncbi:MAG: TlpA family protein disulfide reductase [Carboxylicivirga sp.]|jgi:thiol-disulfide isomerase/thioredoxin|nr:TlpA family protein disulfide reductase [Carboxylicivirga sp.]
MIKHHRIILFFVLVIGFTFQSSAQKVFNFSLENLEGDWVEFEELQGDKLTIIDFWASWCKPCLKSMPKIDEIYNNYKDQGLNVISINTDGPRSISKVLPLSQTLNLSYPVLSDINNEVSNELNVSALPTLLLVDQSGEIIWRHEGWSTGNEKEIEAYVKKNIQ